eukprot:CAMPEP_0202823998 /NCGR_PEP_ID=MMETSP1389-20130828/12064_1 /ASSEMBLY_ACC=CAM_ASM_000865 /TAXON_ID=302021 /ORGANISM="Rhodomonas sp., Strain CCMP768" /LENGTH=194 /DNA_ID=CAMNT_0049497045 /DNA_START=60 /DNA_END=645 /DNA_ORIENTATION=-
MTRNMTLGLTSARVTTGTSRLGASARRSAEKASSSEKAPSSAFEIETGQWRQPPSATQHNGQSTLGPVWAQRVADTALWARSGALLGAVRGRGAAARDLVRSQRRSEGGDRHLPGARVAAATVGAVVLDYRRLHLLLRALALDTLQHRMRAVPDAHVHAVRRHARRGLLLLLPPQPPDLAGLLLRMEEAEKNGV